MVKKKSYDLYVPKLNAILAFIANFLREKNVELTGLSHFPVHGLGPFGIFEIARNVRYCPEF
jgi:hypothetical protein